MSEKSYTTVKSFATSRFEDRKSVFIGLCAPVSTEDEALAFIASAKKAYPDAKHHVFAYVLKENSITRFSDDREPQGTAGMPVLDAIRKNNCVNTVIVVIRYFGGVLLGTGGLVHAYSEAAVSALKNAEVITYDLYAKANIKTSYSDYQKLLPLFSTCGFFVEETEYLEDINISGAILESEYSDFETKITEATSGRSTITYVETVFDYKS